MRNLLGAVLTTALLSPLKAQGQSTGIRTDTSGCPGYSASDVKQTGATLTAILHLAGSACNCYGVDVQRLKLQVTYEERTRIHVKITDADSQRFEVPASVFTLPGSSGNTAPANADIIFKHTNYPFSFSIERRGTGEKLFDTAGSPLIYESQYLNVKTTVPQNANIYGLGEHTENFRLPPDNTTRTMWNRDAYGIPTGTNLYGSHPVYFEARATGAHGVFLLNSNGMDIKLRPGSLEYNVIGGVLDFYFFSGPRPVDVARQYAQVAGLPAEVPYWSLGFHQCRYGYKDYVEVAQVISNYSAAGIPLETMWTDIDYMYKRRVFTLDPDYFPLAKMREIVDYLHKHDQRYIMMVDPAVAYVPGDGAFERGKELDVFLKEYDGSLFAGVVWPGKVAYPDWFAPKSQQYWSGEIETFFSPTDGIDVDGLWIDMNEAANFANYCDYPCKIPALQPDAQALASGNPPDRTTPPPAPGTPPFPVSASIRFVKRSEGGSATTEVDYVSPPYAIQNVAGGLSNRTHATRLKHANGLRVYDTHNLYGTQMSLHTKNALDIRRPGQKTLVVTRSTFAGAGRYTQKWLGDNMSTWELYRRSIAGMLGFASIYQVPVVGSDVCGFGGQTTETLCARWAMLGAFQTFYRNHNELGSIPQEFYRWPTVAVAAKKAIDVRYRLLDYIYTHLHVQHLDGTPVLNPLFFQYPEDQNTWTVEHQFFYGPSILVSPVVEEDSTSVDVYLPRDIFYDLLTYEPVRGNAANVTLRGVNYTSIPLHIRGGSVVPMRAESGMTTSEVRKKPFDIIVAPGVDGTAAGTLYIDDGISVTPTATTMLYFSYNGSRLVATGEAGYTEGARISSVVFLGARGRHAEQIHVGGKPCNASQVRYDGGKETLTVGIDQALDQTLDVELV